MNELEWMNWNERTGMGELKWMNSNVMGWNRINEWNEMELNEMKPIE